MASQQEIPITIQDDSNNSAEGTMYLTAYNPGDRTTRSITALIGCWLGAGVSIFIPLAHFFLVPGFFIAGPILAFFRYKQTDAKDKIEGTCPRHHGTVTIKLENTDQLPKWTYCPECDGAIQLIEKPGS